MLETKMFSFYFNLAITKILSDAALFSRIVELKLFSFLYWEGTWFNISMVLCTDCSLNSENFESTRLLIWFTAHIQLWILSVGHYFMYSS